MADKEKSSEKGADFFKEFDLVIATACSKVGTSLLYVAYPRGSPAWTKEL